jgi:aryl-alcohol dehydrogenase-like predicted oxidoreductase
VDFDVALATVEKLKKLVPADASLAQLALKWILEFPAVTCSIPGAKRPAQVAENLAASDLKKLSPATMKTIAALYAKQIKPLVHHYW